jgi:hypothetical protein
MKKSRVIQAIVGIIAVLAAGYLIWWIAPAYFQKPDDPPSAERLSQEAAQLNRGLPTMLDQETELMVTEGAPSMFIYKYRLVNVSVAKVNPANFAAGAKAQLVQVSCSRPETRGDFLSKGVAMRYSYFDKDKQHIATIDVTPADCGL